MRYQGQGHEINVPSRLSADVRGFSHGLATAFHRRYKQIYGFARPDHPVQAVTWRLRAMILLERSPTEAVREAAEPATERFSRAYFPEAGGWLSTRLVARASLRVGAEVRGPAVVQEPEAGTLILPGDRAVLDRNGTLVVSHG
jgi:N-methylhydantoinase A